MLYTEFRQNLQEHEIKNNTEQTAFRRACDDSCSKYIPKETKVYGLHQKKFKVFQILYWKLHTRKKKSSVKIDSCMSSKRCHKNIHFFGRRELLISVIVAHDTRCFQALLQIRWLRLVYIKPKNQSFFQLWPRAWLNRRLTTTWEVSFLKLGLSGYVPKLLAREKKKCNSCQKDT